MEYGARIKGKYTREMAQYIMEETEQRERREYGQMIDYLDRAGTTIQTSSGGGGHELIELDEGYREAFAIQWTSEYGYPVRIFWHWGGFEIRTARYIGRNCYTLFPGAAQTLEEVARQNEKVSALIIHMSQEQIQHSANVDLETAQRWMIEAEERDPMPEYDADGTRHNRTHNRFGERVR